MKNLIRKILKENNQDEIDRILDKISDKGMSSLTRSERMTLSNSENPNFSSKESIIEEIQNKIDECGWITVSELGSNSITYMEDDGEIHLIEGFGNNSVTINVYGGYKYETDMGDYEVTYSKLDIDTLEEILYLIGDYDC
jgi:hypothetical protein